MNTTNQLQILVQSISFPMLPLFMPSQESIVTGEINFPLHESKLSPFLIPIVNYLPIAALNAGIPFLYPFYHPFLPIHSSRSHPYPFRSHPYPFRSHPYPFLSIHPISKTITYFLSTNTQINVHRLSQIRSAYSPSAQQSLRK